MALIGAGALGAVEIVVTRHTGQVPDFRGMWWAVLPTAMIIGGLYTLLAGGASLGKRIVGAVVCGIATSVVSSVVSAGLAGWSVPVPGELGSTAIRRAFALGLLSPIGAMLTEINLAEPRGADSRAVSESA